MNSKYITRYRKALFEEIEEGYGVSPDLSDELVRLGRKLISSLKRNFEKHPGSKDPHNLLKSALQECLILQERSVQASKLYTNALSEDKLAVLDVFYTIEDVVGDLLKLFLDNWQEAERPEKYLFQIEWNVAKPLAELIRYNARFTAHHSAMQARQNQSSQPVKADTPIVTPSPITDAGALGKLNLRQVALLFVYTGGIIPKGGANEIAQRYDHKSGQKLYEHYRTLSQRAGRTGDDIRNQRLPSMIKGIAAVIPHLTGKARQLAESELQELLTRK